MLCSLSVFDGNSLVNGFIFNSLKNVLFPHFRESTPRAMIKQCIFMDSTSHVTHGEFDIFSFYLERSNRASSYFIRQMTKENENWAFHFSYSENAGAIWLTKCLNFEVIYWSFFIWIFFKFHHISWHSKRI